MVLHQHRFADVQVEGTVVGDHPAAVYLVGTDAAGEPPVAAAIVGEGNHFAVTAVVLHGHTDIGYIRQVAVLHLDVDVVAGSALLHVVGKDYVNEPHVTGVGIHWSAGGDGVGEGFLRPAIICLVDVGDGHHVAGLGADGAVAGLGNSVVVGDDGPRVPPGLTVVHSHQGLVGVTAAGGHRQGDGAPTQIAVEQFDVQRVAGSEVVNIHGVAAVGEPYLAGFGLPGDGGFEGAQVCIGQRGEHFHPLVVLSRIGE